MKTLFEAVGVTKRYSTTKVTTEALTNVDLRLPEKGLVFLVGESGSGKSTLLNLLGGLDHPTSGVICYKGKSLAAMKNEEISYFRANETSFVFQEWNLIEDQSVEENVSLGKKVMGTKPTSADIESVLLKVGLEGLEKKKVACLSGGQKQRVAIARALIKDPKVLFADEPTGSLDEKNGLQIMSIFTSIRNERLVLVVTHNREYAYAFGDRIIFLEKGRVVNDLSRLTDKAPDGLIFGQDEMIVDPSFRFKESDIERLNDYVTKRDRQTPIRIDPNASYFQKTDSASLEPQSGTSFVMAEADKPTSLLFHWAFRPFKKTKVRTALSIFLSSISLAFLALSGTIFSSNPIDSGISGMVNSGNKDIAYRALSNSGGQDNELSLFSDSAIEKIERDTNRIWLPVSQYFSLLDVNEDSYLLTNQYLRVGFSKIQGLCGGSAADFKNSGLSLSFGSWPENENEIAVSSHWLFLHEKMGARLYDPSSGSIWTAEAEKVNESNVIGKGFRKNLSTYFTITGIVDTAFQYDRYSPLIDRTDLRSLETECRLSFSSGFTGMAFCSRETMINSINNNQKLPDMVLSHFDGSREDAKRIVEYADDVNFNASNVNKDMGLTFQSPGFSDPFSYSETILNFAKPSLYFGIGFGVFSILLSFTFFGSIAGEKKHEYGILSSLGVTNKGLSSLTSLSGLIVYVPSLVLGFAFSSIAIYGINLAVSNHIGVSMSLLNVNVGGVLILVLSFIVIGLMSILPALITCKRSIPAKLLLRG